jgi:hypothetical protein
MALAEFSTHPKLLEVRNVEVYRLQAVDELADHSKIWRIRLYQLGKSFSNQLGV